MTREEAENLIKPTEGHTVLIADDHGAESPWGFPWRVVKSGEFDAGSMVMIKNQADQYHEWLEDGGAVLIAPSRAIMAIWVGPREVSK